MIRTLPLLLLSLTFLCSCAKESFEDTIQTEAAEQTTVSPLDALTANAESGNAEAQYELGKVYETGDLGVVVDVLVAVSWYKKAAASGHAESIAALERLGEN